MHQNENFDTQHIDRAYKNAAVVEFDSYSRIVFMSDCHRGYGTYGDKFAANADTYFTALRDYDKNGYTYIELGDGDELWDYKDFRGIAAVNNHIFWLLNRMYAEHRFYMLYGNHDREKILKPSLMELYYDTEERRMKPLFENMRVYESIVLRHRITGAELFLIHGHQNDRPNDAVWRFARFMSRHFAGRMRAAGIMSLQPSALVSLRAERTEQRLLFWAKRERKILIAGHTHRPYFPMPGGVPYFNDGSCVHPRCITAIELSGGQLRLVKWSRKTHADGAVFIGRDVLSGPYPISAYQTIGSL